MRTNSADETSIGAEYAKIGREFGLAPNFAAMSTTDKLHLLHDRGNEPTRSLKFLDLGVRRNTMRDVAGSLRPAASGMQSYLNFCTFGILAPDTKSFTKF